MRLENKVAVVTGAGDGIGGAIARLFAREGARVVCFDIDEKKLRHTVQSIEDRGLTALLKAGNAELKADVERAVQTALDEFGTLDAMVNVVGGSPLLDFSLDSIDEKTWEAALSRNTKTTLWGHQAAVKAMRPRQSGSIISISSVTGLFGTGEPVYAMAKGGLVAFSRALAVQLARDNIRCNVIAPGTIESGAWDPLVEIRPDVHDVILDATPIGYLGTPEDVAYLALYLATDEAAFATGGCFVLDGGLSAGLYRFHDLVYDIKKRLAEKQLGKEF